MALKRSTEPSNDVSGHQTHIDRWSCRHITRTHTLVQAVHSPLGISAQQKKKSFGYVRAQKGAQGYYIEFVTVQHVWRCAKEKRCDKGKAGDVREVRAQAAKGETWECEVCDGKSPGFVRITTAAGWVMLSKHALPKKRPGCIPPPLCRSSGPTQTSVSKCSAHPRPHISLCISCGSGCTNRATTEVLLFARMAAGLLHRWQSRYWDLIRTEILVWKLLLKQDTWLQEQCYTAVFLWLLQLAILR